ncbi:hypothetical protein [Fodinicola feengrottensis]|uniref:hypothetical protein n=1 Tax=Fodinicola feengrottensis TaxID=435914 RepID=UPI00244247D7|nr:hypothetical protein [Fodinicola feengrottensis]
MLYRRPLEVRAMDREDLAATWSTTSSWSRWRNLLGIDRTTGEQGPEGPNGSAKS